MGTAHGIRGFFGSEHLSFSASIGHSLASIRYATGANPDILTGNTCCQPHTNMHG